MIGRIVELTIVAVLAAYIANNGADFARVISSIGEAYARAVEALLSKAD